MVAVHGSTKNNARVQLESVFNSGAQSYGVAQMDLTRRTLEAHLNFKNAAFNSHY